MTLRNTIAAGLGLAACLCLAIAATTAQQTEERKAYTIHRATGNGPSAVDQQPAGRSAPSDAQVSQGFQGAPLDEAPSIAVADGPTRVVVSDDLDPLRGDVPGDCGDTTECQNDECDSVIAGGGGTAACQQGGPTAVNAWARCFPSTRFPQTLVLQCVDFGVQQNVDPNNSPFDVDLRIVQLVPVAGVPTVCPLPPIPFGDPQLGQTWFDLPDEFSLLHIQKVRVSPNFEGMLKVTLNRLVTIPAGANILVEVHAATRNPVDGGDGGQFRVGSNDQPAEGAFYIWSEACGIVEYTDLETLNFFTQFVMRLDGSVGPINGICCRNVLGQGCDPVVTTFSNCNGPTDRFCPNAIACPAAGDPFCPSFEGPGSPPCPFIVPNDDCDGLIILSNQACAPFNSTVASESGVVNPPGFETINGDVFFGYIVKAAPPLPNTAGRLLVSTLGGTDFDTNVAVYRVTAGVDIRTPGGLALVCADIAAGGGNNAVGQGGGFGDDVQGLGGVDNRPASFINPLSYLCIIDLAASVLPGDQFVIRVGSPSPGVGGAGVLNVDYLPTLPAPWSSAGNPGGRCCLANGDCVMVPTLADCQALSGFFRNVTDFFFGRDPSFLVASPEQNFDPIVELTCVGCKTLPCAPVGGACYNPIDLKATLLAKTGTAFGTATRLIRKKLYYKYQLPAGCGAIQIDTCGTRDFDSFIEVFKWDPAYPNNCLTNGLADQGTLVTFQNPLPGTTGPGNTGSILVVNGQEMINDDCRFATANNPESTTSISATGSAPCFNELPAETGVQTDSCLCFPVVPGSAAGNAPGDWILICIGALNPARLESGVNSVDPQINPTFPKRLSSLSIRCLTECFNCTVDLAAPTVGGVPITIDLADPEGPCTDPGVIGTNDGCLAILATSTGGPVTSPPTTPIAPALGVPFYISGNSGIFDVVDFDGQLVQHSDNDWYELTLTQPAKLTWRLVRAEFVAQIAIRRAGNPATSNLCNTTGFLLNTRTPCDDDTMSDLTIDVCAGTYYLSIRPRPPFKPVPCGTASEYLCCVLVQPQKAVNCCPGDANNDGVRDSFDIQPFTNAFVHPPASGTGLRLGGCYEQSFCHTDIDLNGFVDMADVNLFVSLILSKPPPCTPALDLCTDVARCQLPYQEAEVAGPEATLISSDLNIQSFNRDPNTPDNFISADCFCPTESGTVTSVCWWGGYTDRDEIFAENPDLVDCLNTDDFTITYYTSFFEADPDVQDFCPKDIKAGPFDVTGSFVGNPLTPKAGAFNAAPTRTGPLNTIQLTFGDVSEYRYEVSHPAVPVTAGECCWISIVNNTTGRCTWRWESSPLGDNRAAFHENQNQGFGEFPVKPDGTPFWDCREDLFAPGTIPDLAFCVDIRTRPTGCRPDTLLLGQCCFVDGQGQQMCLELTADECSVNYDGLFSEGGNCAAGCPPVQCVITCQAGDLREAEGCGFDKNGGCDDDVNNPPIVPLGTLTCADTTVPGSGSPIVVCGTADDQSGSGNDTDWYSFTIAAPGGEATINLDLEAQPDLSVSLEQRVLPDTPQTDGCSAFITSATSLDGDCAPVTAGGLCLPNGEYLVRVISSTVAGRAVPCDEAAYRVTISCAFPCCEFLDNMGNPQMCPPFAFNEEVGGPNNQAVPCDELQENDGCSQQSTGLFQVVAAADDPCTSFDPPPNGVGGRVFCGTSWAENGVQDEDWWLLPTLATSTLINIDFRSEFPGIVEMVDVGDAPFGNLSDCLLQKLVFSATFAASVGCGGVDDQGNPTQFARFSECIPAGNWVVRVRPGSPNRAGVFSGTVPCSSRSDYQMRIWCTATDCAPACFVLAGGSQSPRLQGIDTDQQTDCGGGLINRVASDDNGVNPLQTDFRAADNFLVTTGGAVSQVQWWGFYENTTTPATTSCVPQTGDGPDDFTITYYGSQTFPSMVPAINQDVTLPDNVILDGGLATFSQSGGTLFVGPKTVITGSRVQITNLPPDFLDLVEFNATHAAVVIPADTCVWIEIVNKTTGNCTWSWAVSDEGDQTSARRDGNPQTDPDQFYKDGDFCRQVDLAWCVDIATGDTGCFVFEPAANDVCAGSSLASFSLTCVLGSGGSDQVTYDLVNYSSQGPLFEPDTLAGAFGGVPGMFHLDCELFRFFSATPLKEAAAWFSFTPTAGNPAGNVTITLNSATLTEILVFQGSGVAAAGNCGNIAGAGEIPGTQFACDIGTPAFVSNTFFAGQTYLIMVAYYDGLTVGRPTIFSSLPQSLVVTCNP